MGCRDSSDSHPTARRARSTYTLNGKRVYVKAGDKFKGEVSILAGAPEKMANLSSFLKQAYDPLVDLKSASAVDRYAAVKCLSRREDLRNYAIAALEAMLKAEKEERVSLEAAGSSAALGSALGQEHIGKVVWGGGHQDLRMEAVLILTELCSDFARKELERIAANQKFAEDEIRQAAVWGLGKVGLKAYEQLLGLGFSCARLSVVAFPSLDSIFSLAAVRGAHSSRASTETQYRGAG